MLSNVLEVLAVLHKDVGKAGNRPADVDDGEDDDGDLGTKILSSFRPCAIFIPTPAYLPSGRGSAVSETEEEKNAELIISHIWLIMITDRIRSSKAAKTYRRTDDDEDADGEEGEVDEEDDVEHCKVAQRRHPITVGLHNKRPEKDCQQDFPLV